MIDSEWTQHEARKSLTRLLPRLHAQFRRETDTGSDWEVFEDRLQRHWQRLFGLLLQLYGSQYDFFYHLEQILSAAAASWNNRPEALKSLDRQREMQPEWFLSEQMAGGVLYVDLFSDNLAKLHEHIPYFKELGLTYLHLMPLFAVPHGDNDGGYAVSSYRAINPELGTMQELAELSAILRQEGISLVLDFVFNHTSDEHEWALRAQAGEPDFEAFYFIFPDRVMPDQYERTLRDIFPTVRRGSFTWRTGMKKWVWTTFNSFQWDLNYANPAVFRAMAEEMLFLANQGVDVLRLDAVAFIWKRLGTDSENQPEAHMIIQAFNCLARIAAPALLFKSEAIVQPDEVIRYVSPQECQLSYNPQLMALLWEALATREVRLLQYAMLNRSLLPQGCSWVNYLRCHDDIGWTFDDDDAVRVGINGWDHRRFLNDFYTGRFHGSFARGVPFQFNPENGDQRISGTLASLAGLEQAIEKNDPLLINMAVRRVNLLRSIILSIGGIPLIYLGEEWGMLNDYTYVSDPVKAVDSRWIHRSRKKWETRNSPSDPSVLEWVFFNELVRLINLRKKLPALWNGAVEIIDTDNPHVFGYVRQHADQRLLVLNNFSEHPQCMAENVLWLSGKGYRFRDHVSGAAFSTHTTISLAPYQFVWLEADQQR